MGANGSALVGKAVVDELLLPFTTWRDEQVYAAHERLLGPLAAKFGLDVTNFAILLGYPTPEAATPLFTQFDTDANGLVDAFEVLGVVAMAAQMSVVDRVKFFFKMFDFNKSGLISKDELVILHSSIVAGCAKVNKSIVVPSTEYFEGKASQVLSLGGGSAAGQVSEAVLLQYCSKIPAVSSFLSYWHGCLCHASIPAGALWEDPDFPAAPSSLYRDPHKPPMGAPPVSTVEWLRPSSFCSSPSVFTPASSGPDLLQGSLADLWFLNALATLHAQPALLTRLFVPTGQEAQGRYCVQLYKEGDWMYVYVDDRIPCSRVGKPLYSRSSDPNELWPLLIEKAYAKVHGTYESLLSGGCEYALKDLTGGVPLAERLDSKSMQSRIASGGLWGELIDMVRDGLVGAVQSSPEGASSSPSPFPSIVEDHVYGVVECVSVGDTQLVKVKNVWGMKAWDGRWGNDSPLWASNPAVAAACKFTGASDDGCFWMAFEDFYRAFHVLYSCRLLESGNGWLVERREDEWTAESGGGCLNFPTWTNNHQFALELPSQSEVVVSLSQTDARYHIQRGPQWNKYKASIGLVIAAFDWKGEGSRLVPLSRVSKEAVKGFTAPFQPSRDVTLSLHLPPGRYVIIPMTFQPAPAGKFWLSVYTQAKGFTLLGGTEVDWDDAVESVEASETITLAAAKPSDVVVHTAKESAASMEDATLSELHITVDVLSTQVKKLKERKSVLEGRLVTLQ